MTSTLSLTFSADIGSDARTTTGVDADARELPGATAKRAITNNTGAKESKDRQDKECTEAELRSVAVSLRDLTILRTSSPGQI